MLFYSDSGGSNPTPFDTPGEIQDNKIYGDVYELLANYDFVANDEVPKVKILVTHALLIILVPI